MKISLAVAAAAAVLLSSTFASAQTRPDYTEQKIDGATVVTFPGDQLPGDLNDPYGGVIHRPPRVLKAGLIQPRLNFIPELLKTVENL